MLKTLKKLGLSDIEISVYLTSIKNSSSSVTTLSRLTGVKRTSLYSVLDRLIELGIISERKVNKEKLYSGENPKSLVDLAKKRQEEWKNTTTQLEQLLPDLEKIASKHANKTDFPNVKIYQGSNMAFSILKDFFETIKKHKNAYEIVDGEAMLNVLGLDVFRSKVTRRRRQFKDTKIFTIARRFPGYEKEARFLEVDFREMRLIDNPLLKDSLLIVCGDKIWIGKLNKTLMITVIQSQEVANLVRFVWEIVWKSLE